ncbi:MAG: hypothetical protein LC749_07965 [Actinobacteria bacterium]|nr:hypothetical protein [Actinomycetota bacterium]
MGPVELVVMALAALVPIGAVIVLAIRARAAQPEVFADAHGFSLTDANRPLVGSYLDRSWKWRITGAVLGVVIPFGTRIPGLEMLGGYLVGALAAELTHARLRRSAQPAASLAPRSLTDYIAPGVLRALRAAAVLAVALVPMYHLLPRRASVTDHPQLLVASGLALITATLVEGALRVIVRRPQPAIAPDVVSADDAIRAASIHATAGAGLAIVVLLVATELWAFGFGTDVQLLRWVAPVLSISTTAGAFVIWSVLGHDRPWRVRRNNAGEVPA